MLTTLPARLVAVPLGQVLGHWPVVANLLLGSLAGAWLGASWATRLRSPTLHRVLAPLLLLVAAALARSHLRGWGRRRSLRAHAPGPGSWPASASGWSPR